MLLGHVKIAFGQQLATMAQYKLFLEDEFVRLFRMLFKHFMLSMHTYGLFKASGVCALVELVQDTVPDSLETHPQTHFAKGFAHMFFRKI